ncbi:MAG: hypothetical protein JO101_07855, partial [Candidatus Eremiobacteraeota bacterium]|nr:hypothetical protein [Candidatus Eremiobacteraeota bacterium]
QSVTVGTNPLPQVIFYKTGTTTNIFPTSTGTTPGSFQLGAAANSQLTIVIEGRATVVGAAGLNLGAFIEPTITNASGTYSVVFHHASPSAALASVNGLDVGSFTLASPPVYERFGTMLFSSQAGSAQSFFGLTSQAGISGPPGIAFFVGPVITASPAPTVSGSATPSPSPSPSPSFSPTPLPYIPNVYAALVPGPVPASTLYPTNGVDSTDVNQSIPFNSENNLFIYAIDSTMSPSGLELIGTFNN